MERPKRRKSKDNPYTLRADNNHYFIEFTDNANIRNVIEVSKEIFYTFDEFELEDKKELNEFDRHIEHSDIYDETLYKRTSCSSESIEDEFIRKSNYEDLMSAVNTLPVAIKRRIKLFYFEELSTAEIAEKESCSDRMIRKSLERGRELIRAYFVKNKLI